MRARKRPRDKGSRGEREVVAMFRSAGWDRAARSPGSGSIRPFGAGDMSPWPGDLCFVEPWLVEVKYDERVEEGGVRTWAGSTFVKATLRDLEKLWVRHAGIVGRAAPKPVLFARANLAPWRVWVPTSLLGSWHLPLESHTWVEITPDLFFEEIAHAD